MNSFTSSPAQTVQSKQASNGLELAYQAFNMFHTLSLDSQASAHPPLPCSTRTHPHHIMADSPYSHWSPSMRVDSLFLMNEGVKFKHIPA